MRHLHNRVLHGWGIAQGFDVQIAGAGQIEVRPGFAIDTRGREIVLEESLLIDVGTAGVPGEDLSSYVTASWEQLPDELDHIDFGRWIEWPGVSVAADPPSDPGIALMLARIVERDGALAEVDCSGRRPIATGSADTGRP